MKSAAALTATFVYRALLHLYPGAFRLEFGDEMACDFEDATTDGWTTRGWIGMLTVWVSMANDLMRTIAIQWLRNGAPTLIAASAIWTVSWCVLIAQQGMPQRDMSLLIPPRNPDQEMLIMLLGSAVVVLLIVATVLITGWFWMSVVKRRSRA